MHLYYSVVDPYPAYRADLVELFAVELRKLGLKTEWFMAAGGEQIGSAQVFSEQLVHRPRSAGKQSNLAAKLNYWFSDIKQLVKLFFRDVDAIQCRDKYLASLVALLVSRVRNVPFFYWCSYPFPEHDRLSAEVKTGWHRWLGTKKAQARFWVLYKVICPLADHIFVQSQRMKEDMHGYGISHSKMTAVPMGVSARIGDWVKANPISVVPKRVVYLGSLAAVRRLDVLLDAFQLVMRRIPDAQLLLVGDGDQPSERALLEAKVTELELSSHVVFTGFIPMEEAWALSASASVCVSPVYPSKVLAAASPTKLVEYMALGRPVVCNDHPEQSQIIQESGAGLCVEWSAEAFADAITELLLDSNGAEIRAARGPAWVSANRTYPMIAEKVWAKYGELMSRRK